MKYAQQEGLLPWLYIHKLLLQWQQPVAILLNLKILPAVHRFLDLTNGLRNLNLPTRELQAPVGKPGNTGRVLQTGPVQQTKMGHMSISE